MVSLLIISFLKISFSNGNNIFGRVSEPIPRYNESCSSPGNAQLCENDCFETAVSCFDECDDQGRCFDM